MVEPIGVLFNWAGRRILDATWGRVASWVWKPVTKRKILIVGPGGVGKTTLGQFLAGPSLQSAALDGEYTESITIEQFALRDDPNVEIVILPGQKHRMVATSGDILDGLKKGEFRGVILVMAYGHHALGDISYKNHRLYDDQKPLAQFLSDYLASCLKDEEKILGQICDAIQKCSEPIWLMTLVTKQDLWWNDRDDVFAYYTSGKYEKSLKSCLGSKEPSEFRHESVFLSFLHRNLESGHGEVLKLTAAGYDQPLQDRSVEKLLQVFEGLMEWESQNGN